MLEPIGLVTNSKQAQRCHRPGIAAPCPGPSQPSAIVGEGSGLRLGATEEEWTHLACDLAGLGLYEHLVPVVMARDFERSPRTTISDFSKTPSHFNGQAQAVGIAKWPQHRATMRQIERWSHDGRLTRCLRPRAHGCWM